MGVDFPGVLFLGGVFGGGGPVGPSGRGESGDELGELVVGVVDGVVDMWVGRSELGVCGAL